MDARKRVLTVSDPGDLIVSGEISRIDEEILLRKMKEIGIVEEEIQYHANLHVEMVIPEDKAAEFIKTLKESELNDLGIAQKLMTR